MVGSRSLPVVFSVVSVDAIGSFHYSVISTNNQETKIYFVFRIVPEVTFSFSILYIEAIRKGQQLNMAVIIKGSNLL